MGAGKSRVRRARNERGANLVEFAIVMPLLLLLILGIIEFGYLLGEYNDVRHGAREGARLAAVSGTSSAADPGAELLSRTCESMDLSVGDMKVAFTSTGTAVGDTGTVTVTATVSSLSGLNFIEVFLPNELESTVEFRLEQPREWNPVAASDDCP